MTVLPRKRKPFFRRLLLDIQRNWILYVMILPVIAYFITFNYIPMAGIQLAFKKYRVKLGIWGSPWVKFDNFERFFSSYQFGSLIKNTLTLSVYSLVVGFPIPILFALLLNQLNNLRLKKTVQMVSYAPHFISTVVICGMLRVFTNPGTGVFNIIGGMLGFEDTDFLGKPELFKHLYVWSGVWQQLGWNSIIYVSALAGVDPQMHEAAIMDGASKWQRIIHIDLPSIRPTIAMLLILRFGSMMNVGFEKVWLLQNSLNYTAASTISTFVYEVGMLKTDYGFSTAVGLFNTVINVILLTSANYLSKKMTEESLF